MPAIKKGDHVTIRYSGTLEDGRDIGPSEHDEPLTFKAGKGEVIAAIDDGVIGHEPGETVRVVAGPADGFGERDPKLTKRVSRAIIPPDTYVGQSLVYSGNDIRLPPLTVAELGDDYAILDGNHPLAGQTVELEIRIESARAG